MGGYPTALSPGYGTILPMCFWIPYLCVYDTVLPGQILLIRMWGIMADWHGTGLGAGRQHTVPPLTFNGWTPWYAGAEVVARLYPKIKDDFNGSSIGAMAPDREPRECKQYCALSLMGGPNSIHEFTMLPG